ncbi:MAG: tRNA (adenosine(37)-N6)-dimethylallyltransferase MiaA [bacterium]
MAGARRPMVCLVGPTAVGKTALIARLAAEFPIEVISLDSRQIYEGLRVGTAQPTAEDLAACPHHLVDFLPCDRTYDAMRFREDFQRVWTEIHGRGRIPVLVGGAGLYLKGLEEGFLEIPGHLKADLPGIRAGIEGLDPATLARRLAAVDRESADRLHPNDLYRRRRALEIHDLTGIPMSRWMAEQRPDPCLGLDFRVFVLQRPVAELEERIRMRTSVMLAGGWVEETRQALTAYPPGCPGLRSIGYPEVISMIQGRQTPAEAEQAIVLATRQYAKRQRTWFRKLVTVGRGRPEEERFRDAIRQTLGI